MTLGSAMVGDTTIHMGASATVQIHVTAPSWAQPDTLTVYTNGGSAVETMPIPNQMTNNGARAIFGIP